MSDLLTKLAENGVTQEDLEKAASVRLFEKVASAQGFDLNQLTDEQVAALYEQFENEVLPTMVAGGGAEVTVEQKVAGLSEDQIYGLFDKQASAEGLDPSQWNDEQLNEAFGYFLEEVLPAMAENGFEPVVANEKQAQLEETQAKLAEADILGRQMGRGFMDELNKLGSGASTSAQLLAERGFNAVTRGPAVGLKQSISHAANNAVDWAAAHPKTSLGIAAGSAGGIGLGGGIGGTALTSHLINKHREKKGSVELTPDDVAILAKIAAAGDVEAMREAAAAIKAKSEEKDEESKEKKADSALDMVVEEAAVDLANNWLRTNGYLE